MQERQLSYQRAADANLSTPAGARYAAALEHRLHGTVQACIAGSADKGGKFQVLILMDKAGKLERVYVDPFTTVSQCLMAKLADYYGPHAKVLLVPPQDAYWIKFDMDPENIAQLKTK
jgi:hypothetical protein